jgi:hypothetical protein
MDVMDRVHTIEFLHEHVKTDVLMKHLLTVDTVYTMMYSPGQKIRRKGDDDSPGEAPDEGPHYRQRNHLHSCFWNPPGGRCFP